jgi:chaperonin GroEL
MGKNRTAKDADAKIVLRAVEEPLRIIAANAGDKPSTVVAKALEGKSNIGYNAALGTYGDMLEMGALDPTIFNIYRKEPIISLSKQ